MLQKELESTRFIKIVKGEVEKSNYNILEWQNQMPTIVNLTSAEIRANKPPKIAQS